MTMLVFHDLHFLLFYPQPLCVFPKHSTLLWALMLNFFLSQGHFSTRCSLLSGLCQKPLSKSTSTVGQPQGKS